MLPSIALAFMLTTGLPAHSATKVTVGGPFTLTAPDGTTVTDETYRGKWLLVFFGYTYCPDVCPTTLMQFAAALERLGADAAKVQPIFITIDPNRDTPEVMGEYVEAFDSRIVGLTGSQQQIAAVSEEYGAYSERREIGSDADDYLMDHGTYVYIMDPQGRFVRGLDSEATGRDIADALRKVMKQLGE